MNIIRLIQKFCLKYAYNKVYALRSSNTGEIISVHKSESGLKLWANKHMNPDYKWFIHKITLEP